MNDKRLTILVDPALLARFKAVVALRGQTMSDVIRELVETWVQQAQETERFLDELWEEDTDNFTEDKPVQTRTGYFYTYTAEVREHRKPQHHK